MWDVISWIVVNFGIHGLIEMSLVGALLIIIKAYIDKDKTIDELRERLINLSDKRREDEIRYRNRYYQLTESVKEQLGLLIEVFKDRKD
jgi:hypothetical protein